MRYLFTLLVCTYALFVSGCVAKSSHVKRGDMVRLQIAQNVDAIAKKVGVQLPPCAPAASQVARAPASYMPTDIPFANQVFGMTEGLGVGGTLLGLLWGFAKSREAQKRKELAYEVANMEPEEANRRVMRG